MKKVLSLDLGLTTGWAVVDQHGVHCAVGTIPFLSEVQFEKAVTEVMLNYLPSWSVIEAPVLVARGELQGKLSILIQVCRRVFNRQATWIQPADWKGTKYKTAKIPWEGKTSAHERDAYRMALWFAEQKL